MHELALLPVAVILAKATAKVHSNTAGDSATNITVTNTIQVHGSVHDFI